MMYVHSNKYGRFLSPLYLAKKLESENHEVKWGCNGISVHFSRWLDLQINHAGLKGIPR